MTGEDLAVDIRIDVTPMIEALERVGAQFERLGRPLAGFANEYSALRAEIAIGEWCSDAGIEGPG